LNTLASLLIAYLLGSIPTAVWVSRIAKKIDIREYGSKNAGLTNVFRVLGWKPALPVVFVDLCKGMLAPYIAMRLAPEHAWLPLVAGLLAIVGHSFTCMAGFRGGKGVLTAMGVFSTLSPIAALLSFAVWILTTVSTGFVSLASILGCLTLVILLSFGYLLPGSFVGNVNLGLLLTGTAVAVFVIVKHKANIKRLMNGTENGFKKRKEASK